MLWLKLIVGVIAVWWLDRAELRGRLIETARVLKEEREIAELLGAVGGFYESPLRVKGG